MLFVNHCVILYGLVVVGLFVLLCVACVRVMLNCLCVLVESDCVVLRNVCWFVVHCVMLHD